MRSWNSLRAACGYATAAHSNPNVSATAGLVTTPPRMFTPWANDALSFFNDQTRVLTGVDRLRTDAGLTKLNGGLPVSGRGDFSVVINDSGIDGTHEDLKFGENLIQNVQILTDTTTLTDFTPLLVVENLPDTDSHVGHGTHCAGIVGGTGERSGGRYAGVAPGARLIGLGSGAGLFVLNALGGFEWTLANQFTVADAMQVRLAVLTTSIERRGMHPLACNGRRGSAMHLPGTAGCDGAR